MLNEMNPGLGNLGKWMMLAGLLLFVLGGLVFFLEKAGLFRLPGDLSFGGKSWHVFMPVTSCIVISLIATFILWLINHLNK